MSVSQVMSAMGGDGGIGAVQSSVRRSPHRRVRAVGGHLCLPNRAQSIPKLGKNSKS
jgi:hypothetical protein